MLCSSRAASTRRSQYYQAAVRLYPTGERGHTQFATALASAGRLDQAISEWREALRLVPDRLSSHLGLADALLAAGDPSQAAAECREILDHEPRLSTPS